MPGQWDLNSWPSLCLMTALKLTRAGLWLIVPCSGRTALFRSPAVHLDNFWSVSPRASQHLLGRGLACSFPWFAVALEPEAPAQHCANQSSPSTPAPRGQQGMVMHAALADGGRSPCSGQTQTAESQTEAPRGSSAEPLPPRKRNRQVSVL